MVDPVKVEAKVEPTFAEQLAAKPEGHVAQGDLNVEGDPFAGAGDQAAANIAAAEAAEAATAATAAAAKESGQGADSPTAEQQAAIDAEAAKQGQEGSESPTGQEKGKEASEADTSTAKPDEAKPLPYDKDDKWLAARAAEKTLNDMAAKHGLSVDELDAALSSGIELKDIIGSQDANTLVEKAQKMDKTEQWWQEQEDLNRESEETPEVTRDRLKKENANLKTEHKNREAARDKATVHQQSIRDFENIVDKAVDNTSGLSATQKSMARNLLGVDNPIDSVDIADKGKVKSSVQLGVENFEKFVADIKQTAIDEYAAGQSKMTPVPKTTAPIQTEQVGKKTLKPNASVEETFDDGKTQLTEILTRMAEE